MKIKNPQDFWAGLMFIAFGAFFLVGAGNYQMGTAVRMGPGYFPTMLGGLLAVLGAIVFIGSLVIDGNKVPKMTFKPIFFISIALLLFGYLLKPLGFVLATMILVIVSAFGGHEFRVKEVLLLAVGLAIFSVLTFMKGLGLPFQLWPAFFG